MTTFATGSGGVTCNVGGLTQRPPKFQHGDEVRIGKNVEGAGKKGYVTGTSPSGSYHHVSSASGKHIGTYHESDLAHNSLAFAINKTPPDKSKQEQQDVASPQGVPSVEAARKNTEQAKAQEKAAIEKEKQQQMFTTAMDKGRDADAQTKKALGLKPQSHHGRKAHAAAAVAHKDAHKHFQGVSGEKGGLNHDQRAAAERKAAKHKKLAEVHQSMSEVMGGTGTVPGNTGGKDGDQTPTKNATGCPGVGVEVVSNVGMGGGMAGAKSSEARAASSLAAKASSRAIRNRNPDMHEELHHAAAEAHTRAENLHHAAAGLYPKGSPEHKTHMRAVGMHDEASANHIDTAKG